MEKIIVQNLNKSTRKHTYYNRASFTVHSGEIFALVGIAESGKESIIKTLQRLCKETGGKIIINRKDIGTVVAEQEFYPNDTVLATLKNAMLLNGHVASGAQIKNVLNLLGLKSKIHTQVKNLSQNRITRLKIAAAIVGRPGILLLDDPFTSLSEFEAREVRVILKTLAEKFDTAILLTARDFSGIEEIFDTVAVIEAGEIVKIESYNNLARLNARAAKTCVTTPEPNLAAKIITEQFGYPVNIHEVYNVIIDAHPDDNGQAIYDLLVKNGIEVKSLTRVHKSIVSFFDTIRSQRYNGVPS
jgi:ABC-2 type transport system ATP-binding protein